MTDIFIATGEMSGDAHGAKLIEELLALRPGLKIGAVAGPKMRKFPIQEHFPMEKLRVMGFIDVILALPKIIRQFFAIRNKILELSPKAVVFIDYPGFHLRMERSLRKKGYQGKLIHLICPTVWAWGKKRIPLMAENLDLLLTIFPFEKSCFAHTKLPVQYIGHPLALPIAKFKPSGKFQGKILVPDHTNFHKNLRPDFSDQHSAECDSNLHQVIEREAGKKKMGQIHENFCGRVLGIFPGSRKTEIDRNLPLQLKVARRLRELDPTLQLAISMTQFDLDVPDALIVKPEDHYELMRSCHMAIATSGTVTLELALHGTPTVVNFAIKPLDCFIAQKIFHINLPFYAMPNIVVNKAVFPELFGPNLTEEQLHFWAQKLWFDQTARANCLEGCKEVQKALGERNAAHEAAESVLSCLQ
jgi:lipid-A-disaccharide synthase